MLLMGYKSSFEERLCGEFYRIEFVFDHTAVSLWEITADILSSSAGICQHRR